MNIPVESIVRLSCSNCQKRKNGCCIGTLILPNVALTTSFCANSCQSLERNRTIIQAAIHPNYKPIRTQTVLRSNDIALVYVIDDQIRRRYVKLSSVDFHSTVGLKALVLILDDKPLLKVTVIQRCNEYLKGFYLCTANINKSNNIKHCQSVEGIPVFLDGRLLGITTEMNKNICQYPQIVFTAVTPALGWISLMINKSAKPFDTLRNKEKYILRTQTVKYINNVTIKSLQKIAKKKDTLIKVKTKMKFRKRKTTLKGTTSSYTHESSTNSSKLVKIYFVDIMNKTQLPLIENSTKQNNGTAINQSFENHTVTMDKTVSPIIIGSGSSINMLASVHVSSSTSVMDWFNLNYKSKIMKSSPVFLVLTTSTRTYDDNTEFVDLT